MHFFIYLTHVVNIIYIECIITKWRDNAISLLEIQKFLANTELLKAIKSLSVATETMATFRKRIFP